MALGRIIIALVLVAVFMVVGVSAVDEAFTDSGQTVDIEGETLNTGSVGTVEELEQSKVGGAFYDEKVTIKNGSSILMNQGDDYTWFENNGTFKIESSALANENGVTVDYTYAIPNQNQTEIANFFGHYTDALLPAVLFLLVLAAIIGAAARLGGV